MKDDMDYISTFLKKKKRKIIIIAAVFIVTVPAIVMFYKGYTGAKKKYETKIEELEAEVERLSDPTAVYEEASKEVNIHMINAEIQEIGELATVEYLYTDAGKFTDPAKLFGKEIPFSFTTKSFIAKWDGSIKAGVDISKVTAELSESAKESSFGDTSVPSGKNKETSSGDTSVPSGKNKETSSGDTSVPSGKNKETSSGDTSMPSGKNKEIIVHIPKAEILSHEIYAESIETLDEKNGLFNKLKVEDVREFDIVSKEAMELRAIENGILDKAFKNAKEIIYKLINTDIVKESEYTITFKEIEE